MAARVVASIMALLLLAGCSGAANEQDQLSGAFTELMKRPSLTQVQTDYQAMFKTIRERLVTELGVAQWVPSPEPISGSSCGGNISNLPDAEVLRIDAGTSGGNLPDAKWNQAVAIVSELAGKRGFGAPAVVVNGAGDHEVSFKDPYRGVLLFGTGGNTVLTVTTGCHLTQEAHQRGTYLPLKEY